MAACGFCQATTIQNACPEAQGLTAGCCHGGHGCGRSQWWMFHNVLFPANILLPISNGLVVAAVGWNAAFCMICSCTSIESGLNMFCWTCCNTGSFKIQYWSTCTFWYIQTLFFSHSRITDDIISDLGHTHGLPKNSLASKCWQNSVWGLQMQETANRIAVKDANPGFPQTGHFLDGLWNVEQSCKTYFFSTCFYVFFSSVYYTFEVSRFTVRMNVKHVYINFHADVLWDSLSVFLHILTF